MRRRKALKRALLGLWIAASSSACALVFSLDGFGPGGGAFDGSVSDVAIEAGDDGGPPTDLLDDATAPMPVDDAGCPSGRGPTMVANGTYCIDTTHVTAAQYAAFLASKPSLDAGPRTCAWKTSYVPSGWPVPTEREPYPVVFVDWCDAEAFCRWSGKRLCGEIGTGGPLRSMVIATDATKSEWYAACTGNGKTAYPYGSSYEAGACVVGGAAQLPAGGSPRCVGGLPGLFDMNGNAWQWANWCDSEDAGAEDNCRDFGSSAGSPAPNPGCSVVSNGPRRTRNGGTGFRCCAPAVR